MRIKLYVYVFFVTVITVTSLHDVLAQEIEPYSDDSEASSEFNEATEIQVKGAAFEDTKTLSTYATPVDQLEYNPFVDVQTRGFSQAQADVTIRGNTFDQTGVLVGAVPLFDSQTGHYSFEIPYPAHIFEPVKILTNADMAERLALGAGGAVAYRLRPISEGGFLRTGVGDFRLNTQELSHATLLSESDVGNIMGEFSFAHSSSNGSLTNGGNEFFRYFSRFGVTNEDSDTQLLLGLQQKNIRWPNLYVLQELHDIVGSSGIEGDKLDTGLIILNHQVQLCDNDSLEMTAYYRHNHDDYDFDHFNPELFNPFRHTTKTYGGGLSYNHAIDNIGTFRYQAAVLGDEIDSTSLVFGPFSSRVQGLTSATISRSDAVASSLMMHTTFGMRADMSNRNKDTLAPIAKIDLEQSFEHFTANLYAAYAQTSSVPGYTALASNANAGLFRGNPFLSRTVSKSSELGLNLSQKYLTSKTAFFVRRDNDLVDWVYDSSLSDFSSRSARNLDQSTYGFEQSVEAKFTSVSYVVGYSYLDKNANYSQGVGDASFYSGNYARNRLFNKIEVDLTDEIQALGVLEWRDQYPNTLRKDQGNNYLIASLGAKYQPNKIWSIEALVDNVGNENFEEVPGVPAGNRTAGVFLTINW